LHVLLASLKVSLASILHLPLPHTRPNVQVLGDISDKELEFNSQLRCGWVEAVTSCATFQVLPHCCTMHASRRGQTCEEQGMAR